MKQLKLKIRRYAQCSNIAVKALKSMKYDVLLQYILITLPVQTEDSLVRARSYLTDFDRYKAVFAGAGCSLNLPKIHSLQHYEEKIIMFGTPDNFDTEYTEHQHIADAKDAYKRTNK